MGTSSSAAELAGKMGRAARGIQDGAREGVREAAVVGKAIFEAELPARRMGNVGRSGARMGARFTNPTSTSNPMSILSFTGPVHLLNTGARPHLIGPKGWRRGRARGGALKFTGGDDGIRRGVVMHPGTKGAGGRIFNNAKAKVAAAAPRQMQMAVHRSLVRVFG